MTGEAIPNAIGEILPGVRVVCVCGAERHPAAGRTQ